MTVSQQQAVDAAQSYLSMGSGFSQYSLAQQLTSSSGNGFSQADAQFAISHLNPDWDAQAVDAAKGYVQMGGFSAASLTQQLTSVLATGSPRHRQRTPLPRLACEELTTRKNIMKLSKKSSQSRPSHSPQASG